jgi:hypothetical protein
MTIHNRIHQAELKRVQANRAARQAYVDKLYSKGWRAPKETTGWDVAQTACGTLLTLAIIAWWALS